jgi:sugar phosphate isomerase/epimerase
MIRTINRREFNLALLSSAAVAGMGRTLFAAPKLPIGIQLYTVRDLASDDFKGALRKVRNVGYEAFEFAGFGDMDAGGVSTFMKEISAVTCGSHEGFEGLEKDLEGRIAFNKAIGNPVMVVPSMPGGYREGSAGKVVEFAGKLNAMGKKITAAGMKFCYHNHSFEFEKKGGKTIYDLIFENSDPDKVQIEMDLAWVVDAKVDPLELMDKYRGRIPVLHCKDITADGTLAPVGKGIVPFREITAEAKKMGVNWYVVEQDSSRLPILEAIKVSYGNLAEMLS